MAKREVLLLSSSGCRLVFVSVPLPPGVRLPVPKRTSLRLENSPTQPPFKYREFERVDDFTYVEKEPVNK